jgi:hypothetical protein
MKTVITKTTIIAALALIIATGSSCKKEEMRLNAQNPAEQTSSLSNKATPAISVSPNVNIANGKMIVYLKDIGSAGFGAVNLTFTGIALHYEDKGIGSMGWVYVETKPRTLDVLQYQTGSGVILAASKALPIGNIDEVRVLFGNPNYVVWGTAGSRYKADLFLDKGAARIGTALKASVDMKRTLGLTLAINTNMSIDREIADHYVLKPAIIQVDTPFGDVNPE